MSHNELPGLRADMNQAAQGAGPGIPGDDIPLTEAEMKHMDVLINDLAKAPSGLKFTPPPVKGYRALSQNEVDLMNCIKTEGEGLDSLIKVVQGHLIMQRKEAARLSPITASDAELTRLSKAEGERWAAIARTHFQEGLMALTRAVAQPSNF